MKFIERFENRVLLADVWGATAKLVDQDKAATAYPSINGQGVYVAIIDSGIDYNLPQLGGGFGAGHKVVGGKDFFDDDDDPMDTGGHGTEVAGVIAADPFEYNGLQYSGVAPDANLVALRVTDGTSGASDAVLDEAVKWIIDNFQTYPIRLVNISLGSGNFSSPQSNATLSRDLATLSSMGIIVIAASGNGGQTNGIAYPAADPSVFSVGAVNSSNAISSFTQRADFLGLLAPGESVPTTSIGGSISAVSGTSFASPYTVGAAALLAQQTPGISRGSLLSILRASGPVKHDDATDLDFARLDIYYALRLAAQRHASAGNVVGVNSATSNIAYDESGELYLAYYDGVSRTIKFATRDPDGNWSKASLVDTTGNDVGIYLSINVDKTGKPGIAYFDTTNADLKYAHFNGVSWVTSTLDSDKNVGSFPSLIYSSADHPAIVYYRKSGGDLRLITLTDTGLWARQTIDGSAGDVGAWTSVDIDPTSSGDILVMAYVDLTNGDLKYARANDSNWTQWRIDTVDDLSGVGYTSVRIHDDQAFISYQDLLNADLKFAQRVNSTWETETVYTPGNTGQFTSLVFDGDDKAHIAFWSRSKNILYQAVGTFGSWQIHKVATGGAWSSAAVSGDGDVLSFASLDITKRNLEFGSL